MYFHLHRNISYVSFHVLGLPPDFCLYDDIYLLFGMLWGCVAIQSVDTIAFS